MPAKGSPEQFALDVKAFAEKAKVSTKAVVIETIQDINEQIVVTTPFKTGLLRGSWFASLNTIPTGAGSIGSQSAYRLNSVAQALELGDTYYAGNTAKYARRLEYGFVGEDSLGRSYNQQGRFWVRAALNSASSLAMAAAQRIAAGQQGGARPGGGGVLPDIGYVE